MNLLPSTGITIDAEIVDPNQTLLKRGTFHGLLRLEISTSVMELRKVISKYPRHYGTLLNPSSYGKSKRHMSASVGITLVLGGSEYQAQLKAPKSRLQELALAKAPKSSDRNPWIPCGPVIDKCGSNVKLTGAFFSAGFPVMLWTRQASALNWPKPKPRPLASINFLIQGTTWTLVSPPSPTGSGKPLKPY